MEWQSPLIYEKSPFFTTLFLISAAFFHSVPFQNLNLQKKNLIPIFNQIKMKSIDFSQNKYVHFSRVGCITQRDLPVKKQI